MHLFCKERKFFIKTKPGFDFSACSLVTNKIPVAKGNMVFAPKGVIEKIKTSRLFNDIRR